MKEIKYPKQTIYFICRENKNYSVTAYGEVSPNHVMQTGQPILDTYFNKNEWESKLLEQGITLEITDESDIYNS